MPSQPSEEVSFQGKPLNAWVQALNAADGEERRRAANVLIQASKGFPALLSALERILKDSTGPTRAEAAEAVGDLAGRVTRALPMLTTTLKEVVLTDADEQVRGSALEALGRIGPQARTQITALVDTLTDVLPDARAGAAHALGLLGPPAPNAVPALTTASLRDSDLRVRLEAAVAIWRIDRRPGRVVPILAEVLQEGSEILRWMAADCLGEIGADAAEAVPALVTVLRSPFKARLIRMSVALALERIDPAAASAAGVHLA